VSEHRSEAARTLKDGGGEQAPVAASWVATVELDGEAVLLDERNGTLHHLDPVATVVWARFDGVVTLDELARELSDGFGAEPARVRDDLLAFARQLRAQRLLAPGSGVTTE
jgi:hypothetical protein